MSSLFYLAEFLWENTTSFIHVWMILEWQKYSIKLSKNQASPFILGKVLKTNWFFWYIKIHEIDFYGHDMGTQTRGDTGSISTSHGTVAWKIPRLSQKRLVKSVLYFLIRWRVFEILWSFSRYLQNIKVRVCAIAARSLFLGAIAASAYSGSLPSTSTRIR